MTLDPTGIPLGLFCSSRYTSHSFKMQQGDTLLLYTDGLTEARNRSDDVTLLLRRSVIN